MTRKDFLIFLFHAKINLVWIGLDAHEYGLSTFMQNLSKVFTYKTIVSNCSLAIEANDPLNLQLIVFFALTSRLVEVEDHDGVAIK